MASKNPVISFRLPPDLVAQIESLPERPPPAGPGRTGGASLWVRQLVLQALGVEAPADQHAEQSKRFTEGAIMKKFFAEIEDAKESGLTLPQGLTHILCGTGHGPSHYWIGFPSAESAKKYAAIWRKPENHWKSTGVHSGQVEFPGFANLGGVELESGSGEGEFVETGSPALQA